MFENIRLSFQGIWSHKMRSFLTMLGIIIGIASIIAIVSTIKGTNEQIKQNLIGAGNNLVKVQLTENDWVYEMDYNSLPNGISVVNTETLEQIRTLPDVISASAYTTRNLYDDAIYWGESSAGSCRLFGVDHSYFTTCEYELVKGRGFTELDYQLFNKVVMLDEQTALRIFQDADPIGQILEINTVPFMVIGVVRDTNQFTPTIQTIDDYYTYANDRSNKMFMPSASWPVLFYFDEPQHLILRASSADSMTSAGKAVADILNKPIAKGNTITYRSEDILEQAKQLQELSTATNNQLIWIASISLLVGGIGVMNIMLVSVTERTREIGLKKALGARKKRILRQFLTEAAVLTSIGGLLGVACGIGLAQLISQISETPVAIDVPASVAAVAFSMLIGIVFGLLPSVKAANLNPIDALRYE